MRFIELYEPHNRGIVHVNADHIVYLDEIVESNSEKADENTHVILSNGEIIKCFETIAEIYNAL